MGNFFKKPALLMTGALLVYVCVYYVIGVFLGKGMAIAAIVPVVAAAWYFGVFWGIAVVLLSAFSNLALAKVFGLGWRQFVSDPGPVFLGVSSMAFVAWMIGYLQTLRLRNRQSVSELSKEVEERRNAESDRRESMRFSEHVIESSIDSIVVADGHGNIARVNRAALDLSGYSRDELLGRSHTLLTNLTVGEYRTVAGEIVIIDDEYMSSSRALQNQIAETGQIAGWEYYIVHKDKQLISVEGNIVLLRNEAGEIIGSLAIIRDISDRRTIEQELEKHRVHLHEMVQAKTSELQAREQELQGMNQQLVAANEQLQSTNKQLLVSQRALEQSEQQFRTLVETMNEGLVVRDKQGCFSYANDRLCEILGYSRDELLGQTLDPFLSEDSRKILHDQLDRRRQGIYQAYEMTWIRRDGTQVITSVSPRPIFDEQQQFQGSFAVITDITTQKRLQQQRRESREFLENIFRTTNDGIVVSETDGTIIMANATIEKLLGYDEREMNGVSTLSFFPQEGGFRQGGLEMAALLRKEGAVQNWETEWCRKDGSRLPVEINVTFMRDRDGNSIGAVAAVRDISERRVIEQQLLQAEKLKSLGEMASGVAHDFNNMLTAILGRAQLVKRMLIAAEDAVDVDRKAEIEKGLAVIEAAALDGAETVRRIQDFSRAGASQRFFGSIDLSEVISGALEYTRARWKDAAELKGLQYYIENMLSEPVMVVGNTAELREVFTNCINNSLDAMPQGGTLSFFAECDARTVTLTLRDTGTGIPHAIINRVFDPFFTTKGPQSSGLGMSVSYGILKRHNGSISVSSEEGRGVTLTIMLPLGQAESRERPDIEHDFQGAGLRVLVIDDDSDVREVLVEMLTSAGHRVESASDGQTGLEIFREREFDLVFTDLGMPGISGWDVAREIKSMREQTLLALVTGWDVQDQKDSIEQHSIDFILNKPFQVSHIMDVMNMARKRLNGAY